MYLVLEVITKTTFWSSSLISVKHVIMVPQHLVLGLFQKTSVTYVSVARDSLKSLFFKNKLLVEIVLHTKIKK